MKAKSPILIILAGGKSSRMGSPKGLLDYHGKPWVLEQISRYEVNNPEIIIVLGYDSDKYFQEIPWFLKAVDKFYLYHGFNVKIVINNEPQKGTFSSLQIALNGIDSSDKTLILPIDVPLFNRENLVNMLKVNNKIVIPSFQQKNGHPVMLQPEFWNTLLYIDTNSENTRLDVLIKQSDKQDITYFSVSDKAIYQNFNTINDWNEFLSIDKKVN
jgi:CTP:molybdopterin cytidylyltransferase MocA